MISMQMMALPSAQGQMANSTSQTGTKDSVKLDDFMQTLEQALTEETGLVSSTQTGLSVMNLATAVSTSTDSTLSEEAVTIASILDALTSLVGNLEQLMGNEDEITAESSELLAGDEAEILTEASDLLAVEMQAILQQMIQFVSQSYSLTDEEMQAVQQQLATMFSGSEEASSLGAKLQQTVTLLESLSQQQNREVTWEELPKPLQEKILSFMAKVNRLTNATEQSGSTVEEASLQTLLRPQQTSASASASTSLQHISLHTDARHFIAIQQDGQPVANDDSSLTVKAVKESMLMQDQSSASDAGTQEGSADNFAGNTVKHSPLVDLTAKQVQSQPQLQTEGEPVKVQAKVFADEMSRMVRSMQLQHQNGISEAKIVLDPEHLGTVKITLQLQNGSLVAQFLADTAMGRDILDQQISQLRHNLQQQGIHVEKLEVSQSSVFSSLNQENRRSPYSHSGYSHQPRKDKIEAYEQSELYPLDDIEMEMNTDMDMEPSLRMAGSRFQAQA